LNLGCYGCAPEAARFTEREQLGSLQEVFDRLAA
jgi:hypothetical protein